MARTDAATRSRARARRREGKKAHARAGVLQLGAAIGLLLTMPGAISHSEFPQSCAEPGRCVASAVTDALIPIVLYIGAGVIAGMLVAMILCRTVPGLKRREL